MRKENTGIYIAALLGIAFMCLSLAGCGSFLRTSASMRVEVEVYKGPLSKSEATQFAELLGLIEEAGETFKSFNDTVLQYSVKNGFANITKVDITNTENIEYFRVLQQENGTKLTPSCLVFCNNLGEFNKSDCLILAHMINDASQIIDDAKVLKDDVELVEKAIKIIQNLIDKKSTSKNDKEDAINSINKYITKSTNIEVIKNLTNLNEKLQKPEIGNNINKDKQLRSVYLDFVKNLRPFKYKTLLQMGSQFSKQLSLKANYWAGENVREPSPSRQVRGLIATFTALATEYSNQMGARANVLDKYLDLNDPAKLVDGQKRTDLPLSDYLRDSSPTDYFNLHLWSKGAYGTTYDDYLTSPTPPNRSIKAKYRVRSVERLFEDQYWSKINTVYASGQGEFRMAVIKDDIGNWNLKSYDNDPSELLKTYRQVAEAGLKKAFQIASTGGANEAVDLATKTLNQGLGAKSDTVAGAPAFNVKPLRERTIQKLEKIKADAKKKEEEINNNNPPPTDENEEAKKERLQKIANEQKPIHQDTLDQVKAVLDDYDTVLEALQEVTAAESKKKEDDSKKKEESQGSANQS